MKTIHDLHDGKCIVITRTSYDNTIKEFNGSYSDEYQCVFFTIPSTYDIIGYKQED